ncbi:hypothetical protein RE6C_04508 [Rhodopirellula europaea 6C]|uniref:Uncharacterized protein n=1 Tax=Rhodopirellula europaea 6C TaxID=1263867 RepID=M2A4M5_9BACT|nr:hypothetical protein RE6C_04508 [Rhodopirellula europaea 6C]
MSQPNNRAIVNPVVGVVAGAAGVALALLVETPVQRLSRLSVSVCWSETSTGMSSPASSSNQIEPDTGESTDPAAAGWSANVWWVKACSEMLLNTTHATMHIQFVRAGVERRRIECKIGDAFGNDW